MYLETDSFSTNFFFFRFSIRLGDDDRLMEANIAFHDA